MEKRRTQRYRLQLPVQIVQIGEQRIDRLVRTRDISSGGVCFLSEDLVDIGSRIEYTITLSAANPPVRIRCLGKVLRCVQPSSGYYNHYEVAATMERYYFVRSEEMQAAASA